MWCQDCDDDPKPDCLGQHALCAAELRQQQLASELNQVGQTPWVSGAFGGFRRGGIHRSQGCAEYLPLMCGFLASTKVWAARSAVLRQLADAVFLEQQQLEAACLGSYQQGAAALRATLAAAKAHPLHVVGATTVVMPDLLARMFAALQAEAELAASR